MKATSAVLVAAVVTGAVLWWKLAGRANSPAPLPEVPLPPGTSVAKRLEPVVNLQSTRIIVGTTSLHPAEVERHFRVKLAAQGWREEPRPVRSIPYGTLHFRKGCWELAVVVFAESGRRSSNLVVQVRPAAAAPRKPHVARTTVLSRLRGFPLYPGVHGALLIENGERQESTVILYETTAPLSQVARFYGRRLTEGDRPFAALGERTEWASSAYRFRGWPVLVNLCRRPEGGTSVMVIMNREGRNTAESEVEACSGGATY